MFSALSRIISRWTKSIKQQYALRKQKNIDRQAFSRMLVLDDHILADIGITREDVLWANNLPLSQNASLALNEITMQNRGR